MQTVIIITIILFIPNIELSRKQEFVRNKRFKLFLQDISNYLTNRVFAGFRIRGL